MRKLYTLAASMIVTAAMAQETYEGAQLITEDLNGTAKYVGMGGAMEALGADITTMNTNPAGIGLFRKPWAGVSAGVTVQNGNSANRLGSVIKDKGTTNVDLNQIGFVYTFQTKKNSFVNVGFNFNKSRNFNQVINAINSLNDASMNKMTYMRLASLGINDPKKWDYRNGVLHSDPRWYDMSLQDVVNYDLVNTSFSSNDQDAQGNNYWTESYSAADAYASHTVNSGYIGNFDFNLSGNIQDRVFLGITFGIRDVHYNSYTEYDERLVNSNEEFRGDYCFDNDRTIKGSGFNLKVGAIFRPINESPFRIGLYFNTPTWYDLKCKGRMGGYSDIADINKSTEVKTDEFYYTYKLTTPWKFGVSAGTTFGKMLAIGFTYEYSDYSSMKNKIDEGEAREWVYDEFGYGYYDYFTKYSADRNMDRNTKESLRGVSLLKVGVELKPVKSLSLRAGYNYQSPIYSKNGSKDMFISPDIDYGSPGNYYTAYDYTNWGATHRVTFGLGFNFNNHFAIDLSYQYAKQKGDYHPFQSLSDITTYQIDELGNSYPDGPHRDLYGTPTSVSNIRHQFNATMSYRF